MKRAESPRPRPLIQSRCNPMDARSKQFLSTCSCLHFGSVVLSREKREFCNRLNHEIFRLTRSLPESTQADALMLLMSFSSSSYGGTTDFLKICHVPTWSILYWLVEFCPTPPGIKRTQVKDACTAHSLAIFLHYMDDHLNDGQMNASHLSLLLRSQSWMMMNHAWSRLSAGNEKAQEIIKNHLNDYYSSVCGNEQTGSLDDYCSLFRKQMATGLITPVLLARMIREEDALAHAVQRAYGSFGVAWRLLDDINDIETDMMKGQRSAVYIHLSKEMKSLWDRIPGMNADKHAGSVQAIIEYIRKNSVIDHLRLSLCNELEAAASLADEIHLEGLADEFRCLVRPLQNG